MLRNYVCSKNLFIDIKDDLRFQVRSTDIIKFDEDDLSYFVFNDLKYEIANKISKDDFDCMLKDCVLIKFTEEDDKWYKMKECVKKLVKDAQDILKQLESMRDI